MLYSAQSARRQPWPTASIMNNSGNSDRAKSAEGRLTARVHRAQLLPAVSPGGAVPRARRHVDVARGVPLHRSSGALTEVFQATNKPDRGDAAVDQRARDVVGGLSGDEVERRSSVVQQSGRRAARACDARGVFGRPVASGGRWSFHRLAHCVRAPRHRARRYLRTTFSERGSNRRSRGGCRPIPLRSPDAAPPSPLHCRNTSWRAPTPRRASTRPLTALRRWHSRPTS